MSYLIDTNIVIDYLKGVKPVVDKISEVLEDNLQISVISLAELYYGAEKSGNPKGNVQKIETFLSVPEIETLTLHQGIVKEYGSLMNKLDRAGIKLAEMDVLIAATAKHRQAIILTLDKKHFPRLRKFGIKVEVII